jgi:Sulfotransferase family
LSVRPIFLLSLPRSGSTLTQRVLASHPAVATAPEPWILLPLLYAVRERGAFAEYGHGTAARAINDFVSRVPGGAKAYREEVRRLVLGLYERAAGEGPVYFVDKTPRYHFVLEELFELFPEAKFVFLWRNPLGVTASIVETWSGGRWNLERWRVDLFDGLRSLVEACRRYRERAHAVRYEDLVGDSSAAWPALFSYLELEFDPHVLTAFSEVPIIGRMGDILGVQQYRSLSTGPLDKWRTTVGRSALRRAWCGRYLEWIGEDRLELMGYRLADLLAELRTLQVGVLSAAADAQSMAYGRLGRAGRERAAALLWSGAALPWAQRSSSRPSNE